MVPPNSHFHNNTNIPHYHPISPTMRDLSKHATKVVAKANKRGEIEGGTFTMSVARERLCQSMGLESGALDGSEEKKAAKAAVHAAIVSVC